MHPLINKLAVLSCFLAVVACSREHAASAPANALVVMPTAELKWTDLDPKGAPGVRVATLWGDIAKGPFGALFELPPGFEAPLHTHTHAMKVVILSGTYIQVPKGKPEFRLGPRSYFRQPGGDYQHVTRCELAEPCIFFVESDGAFDLKPVPAAGG